MQTEIQATEAATDTAQTVDTSAAATEAQASATEAAATGTDTSTTTETEAADSGKQQDEQARDDKGQYKSSVQKRIDDLTFRRNQAEREAAHWKQQALSRAEPAPAPRPGDFDTDADYDDALQQHRIDSGVSRAMAKTAEQQAQKFSQEANTAAGEAYSQRVAETVIRIPDFAEVVGKSDIAISSALQEALRDSERGPDLVYHLAKNPAEAERLNGMSVRQMDREIGRMELTLAPQSKPAPPAARTTSAPPPAKVGTAASAPPSTDPSKMSMAEYEAWAKSNGSKYIK